MLDRLSVSSTNRVSRTFAFIDLSGFTAFTDNHGDDRAVEVLSLFRHAVRTVASARGVRVAKWLGDGAMLVGVEPETVMEAVVDIERRIDESGSPLPLRAGVSTGDVILFEGDDYIGQAVNVAARLCDEARPHEVLAPEASVSSLLVNIAVEQMGPREIPGLEVPIELVSLRAPHHDHDEGPAGASRTA